jgi:ubiquitin C-terminal hydrolase
MKLKNPLGIAAGFDKDGEAIQGLHNIGKCVYMKFTKLSIHLEFQQVSDSSKSAAFAPKNNQEIRNQGCFVCQRTKLLSIVTGSTAKVK